MVEYEADQSTLFDSRGRRAVPINTGLYSEMLNLMDGQQKLVRENEDLTSQYNRTLEKAQYNADLGNMKGVPVPLKPVGHEMDDFGVVTEIDLGLADLELHGSILPPDTIYVEITPTPANADV